MERYEEKYKQALEIAKECLQDGTITTIARDYILEIFPELKESKDDRIVRCLLNYFNHVRYNGLDLKGTDVDEVIVWLEKQGEQKHFSDFKAEDWYVSKVDGKIHNMTYNPSDKVKPKFKVGDWVVNNVCLPMQIASIKDDMYVFTKGDAISVLFIDGNYHLWSINDATDGDVLVDSYSKDSLIILYKGINKEQSILAHCGWNGYNFSIKTNGLGYGGLDNTNYLPATKEQRDLLFSKMKEAGCEWDAEKKELKKIEVVSKESKDERIKKDIIRILKGETSYTSKEDTDRYVTWLEKQGEKATNINGEDYGIDGLYHAISILEKTIGRVEGYQSDDGILEHKAAINAVKELYKKQDEQKHFSDFNANDWYVSKVDGKIHKITYNPTNKFEPKFRVGDFITNDYCSGKVIKITNDGYLLDTGQGIPFSCEHNAHLWTIQDAKEGDVLIKEETEEPFIYNGNHGAYLPEFVGGYCGIRNGEFTPNGSTCYWGRPTCPATKEQRDLLFQKMEEAGYKWDSEKKELKKIGCKENNNKEK